MHQKHSASPEVDLLGAPRVKACVVADNEVAADDVRTAAEVHTAAVQTGSIVLKCTEKEKETEASMTKFGKEGAAPT